MKPNIWIFSLEPIETRYTAQWKDHLPKILNHNLGDRYNITQIDGVQKNSQLTPGAFLNFSDTNYWKSSQLCAFLEQHNQGKTTKDDKFIFTDAWNPTVIQLKYMSDLLGFNWKIHALWHAGSYDPQDFLGRLIGNASWVRHAEKAFFEAIDFNYFATNFHIEMFVRNLLNDGLNENAWLDEDLDDALNGRWASIVRSGWPMEYMTETLAPYKGRRKRDLILFPHRIAPEKQVEIFRDLALLLPQYEFVVCQDKQLTKDEYHTLLGQAKMIFSANLQETLGISCYEGCLVDVIPFVPDRLSYSEMYYEGFKYPSEWTESWDMYLVHRADICYTIMQMMDSYERQLPQLQNQTEDLTKYFFSADNLFNNLT